MSSQPRPAPPPGFVHLILSSGGDPFYLEIPIAIADKVCLWPLKWLRYLGWAILGVEGNLVDEQGGPIVWNSQWPGQSVYKYIVPGGNNLAHAVDLEVIKGRIGVPSETTGTREDFCAKVSARDGRCVWTGVDGVGMHIIPYARGDEWLQLIINNRPHDENLDSLSINDIRNGIYANVLIHTNLFDPRIVVVLKTPNPFLQTTDIPPRSARNIRPNLSYPDNCRYTFQWLVEEDPIALQLSPDNNDATFKDQQLEKPADLLLHYNYGAAAVKHWCKNTTPLSSRPDIPRPSAPVPAAMGPPQGNHDRSIAINKRESAPGGQDTGSGRNAGQGASDDLEVQDGWNEDDIMIFLMGNTNAALAMHAQREQERKVYLENWRDSVMSTSFDV